LFFGVLEKVLTMKATTTQNADESLAMLAHDLRSPLTTARAIAELLIKFPHDVEKGRVLASKLIDAIDRADEMIRDFLDVSREYAGQPEPHKRERCSLTTLANCILDDLTLVHGNRFLLKTDGEPQGVWCAMSLRRALENLLSNAVAYSIPMAEITLSLAVRTDEVVIEVHNWGDPITAEEQKMIFRPYVRTRAAEENGTRGWGLGLMLAKTVAEDHGGRVEVESSKDLGTTFRLVLPTQGSN